MSLWMNEIDSPALILVSSDLIVPCLSSSATQATAPECTAGVKREGGKGENLSTLLSPSSSVMRRRSLRSGRRWRSRGRPFSSQVMVWKSVRSRKFSIL